MKYSICPECGAHLDFGEACDCRREATPEVRTDGNPKGGERGGGGVATGSRAIPRSVDLPDRVE